MRINSRWILASIMIALMSSATVNAQTQSEQKPSQKATLLAKESCAAAPECGVKAEGCTTACGEKSACGLGGCGLGGWGIGGLGLGGYGLGGYGLLDPLGIPDSWELFPETYSGWKVGGWFQLGYHTEGANNFGTGLFNNYPSVVQLQQAWVFAEKQVDTSGCGWDWGFRADYVYGTDGIDTQAFGSQPGDWDTSWDAGVYGHAIPQLYAEVAYNDLKVKVGHFYTIMGYEAVPAPDNFFYSHAYTMALAEPFTHTGALVDWTPCDGLTVYGGWTLGWDTGFSRSQGDTFLGGVSAELLDGVSVTYTTVMGDFGFGAGGSDSNGYAHSIVVDWSITDRVNYVFQTDYVDNQLLLDNVVGPGNSGKSVSFNQYLLYRVNDCWAFGGRFELFSYGGYEMREFTVGANISPHANLVIRPEIRLDEFERGVTAATGARDSTVFGIDAIITY